MTIIGDAIDQYIIVVNPVRYVEPTTLLYELQQEVADMVRKGYRPVGGVYLTESLMYRPTESRFMNETASQRLFCQAMIYESE